MPDLLKFGLCGINGGVTSYPEALTQVAQAAETAGFDSLWAGEHHVIATSSQMIPATSRFLNPLVALTFLAARTTTIRLGTGVVVLPQRSPLVLAKQVASLQALSGGRLLLGIGAGYLEPELLALGVPMTERGSRTDEFLAAMRAIWYGGRPEFHGRHVSFSGVQARPRPGPVPIEIGRAHV